MFRSKRQQMWVDQETLRQAEVYAGELIYDRGYGRDHAISLFCEQFDEEYLYVLLELMDDEQIA